MLDFDDYHRHVLPERLATPAGRMAAGDVRDAPSLAWRFPDGRAWRHVPDGGALRIVPGDDAAVVAELDESAWRDFVAEVATAAGLHYGGRIRFAAGGYADLERWEPALRALYAGRPIFDPRRVDLRDGDGAPLDLALAFALDAGAPLRHFLHTAGFALVKGVFAPDEIARLAEIVERRQAQAAPGDGHSWWATRADGASALCRLIYLGLVEPAIAALGDDPRIGRLMALADEPLRALHDRGDGTSVVIKNGNIADGLSDLPWHRDCGLGGHPFLCPTINIGIQLDAASERSGRLHFAPGTGRTSCHRADLAQAVTVAVDTEPGDCTIHVGDVMHAAPPPIDDGPGRRALYLSCVPERAFAHIPPGKSYNDTILARVGR